MAKWFKFALALSLALAFLTLPVYYWFSQNELDSRIGCDDSKARRLYIVLVDASDPYDNVDANRVIREIRQDLQDQQEVVNFALIGPNEATPFDPIEIASGCLQPKLPADSANFMSEGKRKAYDIRRESLLTSTTSGTEKLLKLGPLQSSPILESIISISKRHDLRNALATTIVIYSDMEQNSSAFSVYGASGDFGPLLNATLERVLLPNVEVQVRRVVRQTRLGVRDFEKLRSFWDSWFTQSGASTIWSK